MLPIRGTFGDGMTGLDADEAARSPCELSPVLVGFVRADRKSMSAKNVRSSDRLLLDPEPRGYEHVHTLHGKSRQEKLLLRGDRVGASMALGDHRGQLFLRQ